MFQIRSKFIYLFPYFVFALPISAQIQFADSSHLLAYPTLKSGVAIAVADMNGDGLDDLIRFSDADTLIIEYQKENGYFEMKNLGNLTIFDEWSVCAADVDENGYLDIMTGGNRNYIKLVTANVIGNDFSWMSLPNTGPGQMNDIYMQASNFVDIDNDGDIDYFACNDIGVNSSYENDGTGSFVYDTSMITTLSVLPAGSEAQPDDPNAGDYGSLWTDYDWDGDVDLYISKCRAGVTDSADGRRVNILLQNDGTGNYTEVGLPAGLRPYAQSWSAAFGDLDNDGDMDCFLINHVTGDNEPWSQIFQNNGNGTFTDVTASTGLLNELFSNDFGIQVIMEDFDNDGWLDIYFTTLNGTNLMLRNNGNFTFTDNDIVTVMGGAGAQSAAAGDLNHDGYVDLIAGFASGFNFPSSSKSDKLLLNTGGSNHFLNVELEGVQSNIDGIGSRIEIYGDFGKQIREVRAGESYGIQNSLTRHFGLGTHTVVDSVIIRWTSGQKDKHVNVAADQFVKYREGCTGPKTSYTVMNTNNDGAGSLRMILKDACDGDSIRFDLSLTGDTIKLTSEIVINKSIVIIGHGNTHTFLSGSNQNRIFNILPGNEVHISQLVIIKGGGLGILGGAVYNGGDLYFTHVDMRLNQQDGSPKAIENTGKVTVDGTVWIEE